MLAMHTPRKWDAEKSPQWRIAHYSIHRQPKLAGTPLKTGGKGHAMLTLAQNIVILVVTMALALALTALLNRIWPCENRHIQNDLIGWQLSVLGTTYAIILGFMLYTVWTNFQAADLNADLEASALRNVYRLADGLPPAQQAAVKKEARAYAAAVIDYDWAEMARGEAPEASHGINENMWETLMTIKNAQPSEILAEDHALYELSDLTVHRRTRLIESAYRLPAMFWSVLLVGAALVLISVFLFGSANPKIHVVQVFSVTLMLTLTLLAIADVNLPFRGWVHVSNLGFVRAQENMNEH
jgi:hypothetical protein